MAVATRAQPIQDTEAQGRLRRAIEDVKGQLTHPSRRELEQARDDIDRHWVAVSIELRRLALPLTLDAPAIMASVPGEPSPEQLEQRARLEYACALLELAREVRGQANVALFSMR